MVLGTSEGGGNQLSATKLPCWCTSPLTLSCARSIDTNTHGPLARYHNTACNHHLTNKPHSELRYCCFIPASYCSLKVFILFPACPSPWGMFVSSFVSSFLVEEFLLWSHCSVSVLGILSLSDHAFLAFSDEWTSYLQENSPVGAHLF